MFSQRKAATRVWTEQRSTRRTRSWHDASGNAMLRSQTSTVCGRQATSGARVKRKRAPTRPLSISVTSPQTPPFNAPTPAPKFLPCIAVRALGRSIASTRMTVRTRQGTSSQKVKAGPHRTPLHARVPMDNDISRAPLNIAKAYARRWRGRATRGRQRQVVLLTGVTHTMSKFDSLLLQPLTQARDNLPRHSDLSPGAPMAPAGRELHEAE